MKQSKLKVILWVVTAIIVSSYNCPLVVFAAEKESEENSTLYELTEFIPDIQHTTNINKTTAYGSFNFNDGTVQDWTTYGPIDEDGDGPFSSHFSRHWGDAVSYPSKGLSDPIGNNRGSYQICCVSGHGITNPGATYWYMYWISPNLSLSKSWQIAGGYTVKILNYMELVAPVPGTHLKLAVASHVTVYDHNQARNRYFRSSYENIHNYNQNTAWVTKGLEFSGAIAEIANKTIVDIMVSVRGEMTDYFEGGIYLDEIVPYKSNPTNVSSRTSAIPDDFILHQNFPNPFNPDTQIQYSLPEQTWVSLQVFDATGRRVAELVNQVKPSGNHSITWNAAAQSSGIYYILLKSPEFTQMRKCILLK